MLEMEDFVDEQRKLCFETERPCVCCSRIWIQDIHPTKIPDDKDETSLMCRDCLNDSGYFCHSCSDELKEEPVYQNENLVPCYRINDLNWHDQIVENAKNISLMTECFRNVSQYSMVFSHVIFHLISQI